MSSVSSRAGGARLSRRRVQLFLLVALVLASAVAAVAGAHSARAIHSTSTIDNISIDMDPFATAANTPTSISTVQQCARINNNNIVDADEDSTDRVLFDVVVGPAGIPIDRPLVAFGFDVDFNPAVVSVVANDVSQLLVANPGSILFDVTDPVPASSPPLIVAALDLGTPNSVYETGPGVLSRLTLEGHGTGQSPLTLSYIGVLDDQNEEIPYDSVQSASVSVDQPCPAVDTDGDGIADPTDACPSLYGIPAANGCPPPGQPLAVGGIVGLLDPSAEAPPQAAGASPSRVPLVLVGAVPAAPVIAAVVAAVALRWRRVGGAPSP